MGGVNTNTPPKPNLKTTSEIFYDIVETLCNKFTGLSPFEVLNTDIAEVFDLYVSCILSERKTNKKDNNGVQWVTSKNATWH